LAVDGDYAIFYDNAYQPGGNIACRQEESPSTWETPTPAAPVFRVFDAATLAHPAGKPAVPGKATPGSSLAAELKVTNTQDGRHVMPGIDIQGSAMRVAKHHEGESGTTFIVAHGGTDVWIYALSSPHPKGQTKLVGPAHYTSANQNISEAVFSGGNLFVLAATSSAVTLERLSISFADVSAQKQIPAAAITVATVQPGGESVEYPTVDVTSHQDAVVTYVSFNAASTPNLIRYAVLLHGHNSFSISPAVEDAHYRSGTKGPGTFRLDYVGSQRDTSDPTAVWSILRDNSGVKLILIKP